MRELKFRAWDKENHCMATDIDLRDFGNGQIEQQLSKGALELMQFTGLLDKNGKEIYEGDIIEAWHEDYEELTTGEIIFKDSCYQIKNKRYWKDGMHDWYSMEQYYPINLDIIGNIYENPELLKGAI